jgi:hypothetical protein
MNKEVKYNLLKKEKKKELIFLKKYYGCMYKKRLLNVLEELYCLGLEIYEFTLEYTDSYQYVNEKELKSIEKKKEQNFILAEHDVFTEIKNSLKDIPFIVFSYIIVEQDKGNKKSTNVRGVFAISPIFPANGDKSYININKELSDYWMEYRLKMCSVEHFLEFSGVISWVEGMKSIDLQKHYLFLFGDNAEKFPWFNIFDQFLNFVNNCSLRLKTDFDESFEIFGESLFVFRKFEFIKIDYNFLFFPFINERKIDEKIIVYLLQMYLQLEKMYLNEKGVIYSKVGNKYSCYTKYKLSFEELFDNLDIVIKRLLEDKRIKFHLEYTDLWGLIFLYKDEAKKNLLLNFKLYFPLIVINESIIELSNGYFFLETNKFLDREKDHKILDKMVREGELNVTKCCDVKYEEKGDSKNWGVFLLDNLKK